LVELLSHPNSGVRKAGVQDLISLLEGKHIGLARAAEEKLREMAANDDSFSLRKFASDTLVAHGFTIEQPTPPVITPIIAPVETVASNQDKSELEKLSSQAIQYESKSVDTKIAELEQELRPKPTMNQVHPVEAEVVSKEPPASKTPIPWRLIVGIGSGVLLVGLLAWGGIKFLQKLPSATPAATQPPATQRAATQVMIATVAPTSAETQALTQAATEAPATQAATEAPTTTALDIGSTMTGKDGMTLLYVPAGEFTMGSDNGDADEKPVHSIYLAAFWIDKTEVTNQMFSTFIDATGYETDAQKVGWAIVFNNSVLADNRKYGAYWLRPFGSSSGISGKDNYRLNYPVTQVSWNDATAYCEWAGRRLTTEAEWEKAARGTDQRKYPWGNSAPTNQNLNYYRWGAIDGSATVGSYPSGASYYGALDMAGNVEEWVEDWFDVYPGGDPKESRVAAEFFGQKYRVVRGGSWASYDDYVTSSARSFGSPDGSYYNRGFRCAMSATATDAATEAPAATP
jgi:formylglycine-generating enzyme required for sulfatase activity